ncbi:MAG TPA: V-type ATP synthase subunit D [Ruminococcaceae bacterium]|nr:V-type ATP synthase subunit D [Oscillospiraceae bacterium]
MAVMNVNPTRMELSRLKKRLVTAQRGHKLLKDKRDELMRQFLEMVRENKALRRDVEARLKQANNAFTMARAVMPEEVVTTALMAPKQQIALEVGVKNVMSVEIPVFKSHTKTANPDDIYSYGLAYTYSELDDAVFSLAEIWPHLLRLAEIEKSCQLMAAEIEKTRRRVNALEHVMIPQLLETIKYITMKLEENDRSSRTRLMKVKDMMLEKQYRYSER